jgi:hypothetical protein
MSMATTRGTTRTSYFFGIWASRTSIALSSCESPGP